MHTIKLNGIDRELRYTNRAIIALENISEPISPAWFENLGHAKISQLIWAGLLHQDRSLKLDDIIDSLPASRIDLSRILNIALLAWIDSQKSEDGEGEETKKKEESPIRSIGESG